MFGMDRLDNRLSRYHFPVEFLQHVVCLRHIFGSTQRWHCKLYHQLSVGFPRHGHEEKDYSHALFLRLDGQYRAQHPRNILTNRTIRRLFHHHKSPCGDSCGRIVELSNAAYIRI